MYIVVVAVISSLIFYYTVHSQDISVFPFDVKLFILWEKIEKER